jgi:cation:H+ antiporter
VFAYTGGSIERWEGIVMAAMLVAYTVFLIIHALKHRSEAVEETDEEEDEPQKGFGAWYERMKNKTWFLVVILVVGLALVIFGADLSVEGATVIAEKLGVSENIIGLTVIAIGTSLPELVTSVTAAIKGKTDIAVGNIVGSNIFNILMVAGLSAAILPLTVDAGFYVSAFIALAAAALLSLFCYLKGNKVTRWAGVILLLGFVAYYVYLFIA